MSHYTLGWHDKENFEHHICEYAETSFQAQEQAKKDVPYLQEHPFSLYEIMKEDV
jgi:hypothetical protein|tara:strand:- start:1108 stop:1272 length:165 start_codon:yes stop_codon:yes gene_type:complete